MPWPEKVVWSIWGSGLGGFQDLAEWFLFLGVEFAFFIDLKFKARDRCFWGGF